MQSPSNHATQSIGKCRLNKLPQTYRDAFQDGSIGKKRGLFVSVRPKSATQLYVMLAFGLVVTFVIFPVVWNGLGAVDGRLDIASRPVLDQVIIYGTLMLLSLAIYFLLTAVVHLWINYQLRRGQTTSRHHYGLLLDSKQFVARLPQVGFNNCYFIPRDYLQAIRFVHPSHRNGRLVMPARLELRYVDAAGHEQADVLALGAYDNNELEAISMRFSQRIKNAETG